MDLTREQILGATHASDVFGPALSDPAALRRAYSVLAKRFRPEDDPEVFAALRRWFERARDGGEGVPGPEPEGPAPEVDEPGPARPGPERLRPLQRVLEDPKVAFELQDHELLEVLDAVDSVNVQLPPHVLDAVESVALCARACGRARAELGSQPWVDVAIAAWGDQERAIAALQAVAERYPDPVPARAALSILTRAHPGVMPGIYRACARVTRIHETWAGLDAGTWTAPKGLIDGREGRRIAGPLLPAGDEASLPWPGGLAVLATWPTSTWLVIIEGMRLPLMDGQGSAMVVGVAAWVLGVVVHFTVGPALEGWFMARPFSPRLARPWTDARVAEALAWCRSHGVWPHELVAALVSFGWLKIHYGSGQKRSYARLHPAITLCEDLALVPYALCPALVARAKEHR